MNPAPSSAPRATPPAINGLSPEYLEAAYEQFKADPGSLPEDMRAFFSGFDLAMAGAPVSDKATIGAASPFQQAVSNLFLAYRDLGHLAAKLDPFDRPRNRPPSLELRAHGLSEADLGRQVETDFAYQFTSQTLGDAIAAMEAAYCGTIGVEYTHIPGEPERRFIRERIESHPGGPPLDPDTRRRTLQAMLEAETFEGFFAKRYQSAKRFSIEGGEALIPLLIETIETIGKSGTQTLVMAMAHRGRLNVLRGVLKKDLARFISEFDDAVFEGHNSDGDVKYHRGYSGDMPLPDGKSVHITLLNNPSHLEAANTVALGRCRALQDMTGDTERIRCVPLLIHGDAALPGQGVVAECLNMANLQGYTVGGTIHVVVNNLVGFTTDPEDSRSTAYCTDIAKILECPVLHVNGMDPDAVVRAARLAAEFRHTFRKDIFIDLVCYRKYGHNEQDEPGYTQPILTRLIKDVTPPARKYAMRLISQNVTTEEQVQSVIDAQFAALDKAQTESKTNPIYPVPPPGQASWAGFTARYTFESPPTAISRERFAAICRGLGAVPEGFNLHPKLKALLASRAALADAADDAMVLSHADSELIAFGSLLLDGTHVRLSGQDSRRGTFSQRHAVLRDEETGAKLTPLNMLDPANQAMMSVYDSPLSEYAVLGFDYGYSRGRPRALTLWEAQFGDFVNGAQIILDQFVASSEVKWDRWAGIVLLLPHGYEGQGPEHSSARLERFLQGCAQDNMEVVYPTTGSQLFHLLRRQVLRNIRKPLVVMTPKKYLRELTGTVGEVINGSFQHIMDDPAFAAPKADRARVTSVIYCTGKIYHELAARRAAVQNAETAIVRIEQLYPLHLDQLRAIDAQYPASAKRMWVQEEPRNQGAFFYISDAFRVKLNHELQYIGRRDSASPASGSLAVHKAKQDAILAEAIPGTPTPAPGASLPNGIAAATPAKDRPAAATR